MAELGVNEQPYFRRLVVDGSSCEWVTIGWRTFFDIADPVTPMFFKATEEPLPADWALDVGRFLPAL